MKRSARGEFDLAFFKQETGAQNWARLRCASNSYGSAVQTMYPRMRRAPFLSSCFQKGVPIAIARRWHGVERNTNDRGM